MDIQARLQEKQMDVMAELKKMEMQINGELMKEKIRQMGMAAISSGQNETKEAVAAITGHSKLIATEVQGQHSQIKQQIANEKPVSKE
jgi:hypothetical protein